MTAADDRHRPGTVIEGKYRIERELGHGGMGVVYEATHLMLARKVAIKLLSPALRDRGDLAKRMIREARVVSAIGHPNIVGVTDLGLTDGTPFIVMELLSGVTLEDELAQRGPLAPPDAIGIASAVLDALDAAHRRSVIHRDIKPANIMLVREPNGRRVVKVLDFGIAKVGDGDDTTKTALVLGTPVALAPEQALGEDVDARADVFAVGALLYTLLVGEPPFAAREATVVIARTLEGKFTPASQRVASVSPQLDAVIARALARSRDDRFPDASAMIEALRACTGKVAAPRQAARTRDVVAAPVAPVRAEPSPPARDGRFAPPAVARLDVATMIDRPPATAPAVAHDATARSPFVPIVIAVVVIAGGFAGWRWYAGSRASSPTDDGAIAEDAEPIDERVLIMISPTPKDAAMFVDGVAVERNPVEVPRSSAPLRVRAEAKGYVTKTIELVPDRSHRVEVTLDRAK
jgi:serine/threonine-protein kinase